MAIKKCPYCKAIIDENDTVCSNCGTQLLFPEDESIEEEIPGDRIVDEEEIEAEADRILAAAEEEEKEKEEIASPGEKEKEEKEEKKEKEEKELPEILAEKKEEKSPEEEVKIEEKVPEEEQEKKETHVEAEVKTSEEEKEGEDEDRKKSFKFDTEDIRKIVTPEEIDVKRIEEFLSSLKKREEETRVLAEKEDTQAQDDMPLWAEKIKDTPPPEFPDDKKEISEEESPQFEQELPDTPIIEEEIEEREEKPPLETEEDYPGVGLQEGLPFAEEEGRRMRFSLPSNLFLKIKIFAFDFLSITAVWILTLWIASRLINTSLSRLFSASAPAIIIFYLILLASYFSLFLFFLGETLGSYIFSEES